MDDSWDDSMVGLEEERIFILQYLNILEERLHILTDGGKSEMRLQTLGDKEESRKLLVLKMIFLVLHLCS